MSRTGGGDERSPKKSGRRLAMAIGLAALVLGAIALVGPGPDMVLGAPCLNCGTTTGGTTTGGTTYHTLSVTVNGPGTVTDAPLSCTSSCSWGYADGETATPSATPDSGYSLTQWSGACTGSGACSIPMDANTSVTATFADTTPPPAPAITSPPDNAAPPNGSSQSVSFTRNDGGGATGTVGFRCRIDNSAFSGATTCTSPWSTGALATGTHTVYVWALDQAGNSSGAASRSFKIVNRPETTIGGTPAQGSVVNTATTAFTYSSSVGGASYQCTLDGNPLPSCASDVHPSEGAHTLTAAAGISPFGDGTTYYDQTPASRTWTVDTKAPETTIGSGPPSVTSDPAASIGFSGADPAPGTALHYECKLDGAAYTPCASPQSYPGLAPGGHTVSVRAIDAAGNADATPASWSWTTIADADHDGVYTPTDCNDANATIHPGAADVPGDGIDQDCSGADTPAATGGGGDGGTTPGGGGGDDGGTAGGDTPVPGRLHGRWYVAGAKTVVRTLTLSPLAAHSRVVVTCKGRGCPFKTRKAKVAHGKAQLAGLFRKRGLRKGTVVTVRITAPQHAARTIRITIRSGRTPKIA